MYTRAPQGRFPREVRIPRNYAGNAFRPPLTHDNKEISAITESKNADAQNIDLTEELEEKISESEAADNKEAKPAGAFSFPRLDIGISKLFSRGSLSLDGEELLIIGLILLIASGGKGDDLILLLILLLFIN